MVLEWLKVSSSDDGTSTAYVNPSTILKNGGKVKMWVLLDFRIVKTTGGNTYLSARQENEFDCKEIKRRLLSYTLHSGNMGTGNVVYQDSKLGNWEVVNPDSLVEILWKFACGMK
jgi:hypothetical protein